MFNNIVYLNRDQDVTRRETTESQFLEHGISAVRFSAITEGVQDYLVEPINSLRITVPQASCLVSHLEIIRNYGDKPLLVFEDDIDLSPMNYWGTSFEDIISCIPEEIGIVQMQAFPAPIPAKPITWYPGVFGTGAYFIKPWYAKELLNIGYVEGKWSVGFFKSNYVQTVADSVLYSNTKTMSVQLFGVLPVGSNILPHATYPDTLYHFSESWKKGINDMSAIKDAMRKFK